MAEGKNTSEIMNGEILTEGALLKVYHANNTIVLYK